jgi:hypothetical protein
MTVERPLLEHTMTRSLFAFALLAATSPASATDYVEVASTDSGCSLVLDGHNLLIMGCNVHIENGEFATDTTNGLGNLIIGYNEVLGTEDCGEWDPDCPYRLGSHNLVVGPRHSYESAGGVVFGEQNTISGAGATVTAGKLNTASGLRSMVAGGFGSSAEANYSAVTGGRANHALASYATVTGGRSNETTTTADYAAVTGGNTNLASGTYATVTGGFANQASGLYASTFGGDVNLASAEYATVVGGSAGIASGDFSLVAGGQSIQVDGVATSNLAMDIASAEESLQMDLGNLGNNLENLGLDVDSFGPGVAFANKLQETYQLEAFLNTFREPVEGLVCSFPEVISTLKSGQTLFNSVFVDAVNKIPLVDVAPVNIFGDLLVGYIVACPPS